MTTDFSFKMMKVRRQQSNFFKHWKEKKCQPRTPYQVYFENNKKKMFQTYEK